MAKKRDKSIKSATENARGREKKRRTWLSMPKEQRQKIRNEYRLQHKVAQDNIAYNNPNQVNPFGSQSVTYDENGNPVVTQKLSDAQQGILEQGQGITQAGQGVTQDYLSNYKQFGTQDFGAKRNEIEDAVFSRLTKNVDQDYANTKAAKEQELYNKGIPFSPDPNSRYQQELRGIDQRYDDLRTDARQRAAEIGGQEYQRQYGIELGTHQQGLSDAVTTQQLGTGLQLPQFQAYQGANIQVSNPTDVDLAMQQLQQNQQQIDIQRNAANKMGGGGGSAETSSPFN